MIASLCVTGRMTRPGGLALLVALAGCVDLELDPNNFTCAQGGPCDAGNTSNGGDAGVSVCPGGSSGTWTELAPSGAIARAGHSAVVDAPRNRALIFGGAGSEDRLFSLTFADPPAFEALTVASAPPARREHAAVYVDGANKMLIFGGINATGAALADTWLFSLPVAQNPLWIEQEPLSAPRHSAAAAMLDSIVDYAVLFDGCDAASVFDDDHQFDVIVNRVGTLETPAPKPSARCDHSATFVPGWGTALFGGRNTAALRDLWLLVEIYPNRSWTLVSSDGPPRAGHTTVFDADRRRLLVFGGAGASGALSDELWAFSIDERCWSELLPPGARPSARAQHAAFMFQGRMYLYGGDDGAPRADLWSLSF